MPSYSTDQDNIVRYVLGDMTVEEQIAFEALMAGNVELTRATRTTTWCVDANGERRIAARCCAQVGSDEWRSDPVSAARAW